jgi:multiple sugar transport system ATP-binding protein
MAQVVLQGVGKTYPGKVQAVERFNLQVEDGEFVVLVGPSGCGKSTTLRMIAGLEDVTQGTISIGDRVVNDVPPKDRDIAMVFQNYALYPHMTVFKNMAFALKLRKMKRKDICDRVEEVADTLGLSELLKRKPKALSGGQRQRVALGRAIVRDPQVFLFDEPLSNLDAKLRVHMRAEISRLHSRLKSTMIYVTHDQVEAMTMGDRIVVMRDGVIQQIATPSVIYARPANQFVAGFIGSPAMNFLRGTIRDESGDLFFVDGKGLRLRVDTAHAVILERYKDGEVTIGVRPELFGKPDASSREAGSTLLGHVEVVEPMGAETYVYMAVSDATWIARLDMNNLPKVNSACRLKVNMKKVHYFDPKTEKSILD